MTDLRKRMLEELERRKLWSDSEPSSLARKEGIVRRSQVADSKWRTLRARTLSLSCVRLSPPSSRASY